MLIYQTRFFWEFIGGGIDVGRFLLWRREDVGDFNSMTLVYSHVVPVEGVPRLADDERISQ